MMVGGTWI